MDQTFDVSTTLWIIGILVTVVMALIGTLWAILRNSINDAYDTIEREREQREVAVKEVSDKLDAEREARVTRHDASIERVFTEIDKVKDKVSDLEVTVAGFGSVYVTRAEVQQRGK